MREVNPALITDATITPPPPRTLKYSLHPWLFLSSQANLPEGRADLWQATVRLAVFQSFNLPIAA